MEEFNQRKFFQNLIRTNPEMEERFRNLIPEWVPYGKIQINEKKNCLLEMAQNGMKKPKRIHGEKNSLNSALKGYTNKKSETYDEDFNRKIRKIRPDWFIRGNNSDENKQIILNMNKKPHRNTKFYRHLGSYISPSSGSYDPEFTTLVKKMKPTWFKKTVNYKKELIEIALSGSKPNKSSKLWLAFKRFTSLNRTPSYYDEIFSNQIYNIAPNWFTKINNSDENKSKLLEMAINKKPRPSRNTKPGANLKNYTVVGSSYDEKFSEIIRKTNPTWFDNKTRYKKTSHLKKQILEIAISNEPKPPYKINNKINPLYEACSTYRKELRKIRPDWYRS